MGTVDGFQGEHAVWLPDCRDQSEWKSVPPQFYIPLPLNIPGTVEMRPKGGGIRYELVANLSHKPKR